MKHILSDQKDVLIRLANIGTRQKKTAPLRILVEAELSEIEKGISWDFKIPMRPISHGELSHHISIDEVSANSLIQKSRAIESANEAVGRELNGLREQVKGLKAELKALKKTIR
jgi:hypothetical protein